MTAPAVTEARTFTTAQVVEATGLNHRQLDYWSRTGHAVPSASPAEPGSGFPRRWTQGDVDRLRQVKARLDWGMAFEAAFRTEDPPLPAPPAPAAAHAGSHPSTGGAR